MECTNPQCVNSSSYLREGSLHLLQLEIQPASGSREDAGFPMRSAPRKFFWLCERCTHEFTLLRWTVAGVVLGTRRRTLSTRDDEEKILGRQPSTLFRRPSLWRTP